MLAPGDPGWAGRGWNLAPLLSVPGLLLQGRPVAAPTGHASLGTSPIILYLCFTLLVFSSLIIVSLWGRQRI